MKRPRQIRFKPGSEKMRVSAPRLQASSRLEACCGCGRCAPRRRSSSCRSRAGRRAGSNSRKFAPPECCALSMKTKSAARPTSISAAIERAHARGIAGREAEGDLGRDVAEARQHRDHADDPERLDARAGGPVGAEDHPVELVALARRAQSEERRALVAIMHELEPALAALRRCSGSPCPAAPCGRR